MMKGVKLEEFVRDLRVEAGLTFCQLADKCGVSPEVLIRIETGECRKPDREVLSALSFELNTSYPFLLQLAGWLENEEDCFPFKDNRWKSR